MNKKNYQSILPEYQPLVAPASSSVDDKVVEEEEERHDSRLGLVYLLLCVLAIGVFVRLAFSRGTSSQPSIIELNQHGIKEESKLLDKTMLHDQPMETLLIANAQFDRMEEWKRRIADIWGPFRDKTSSQWNKYKETLQHDSELTEDKTWQWWKNFAEQTEGWWNETTQKAAHLIDAENKRTSEWLRHEHAKNGSGYDWWNETTKKTGDWVAAGNERTSEWLNSTEKKLNDEEHSTGEWFNETEHKTADWVGNAGHKSAEWLNETEHESTGWIEDVGLKSAEWVNETEHESSEWLSDKVHKSVEWWNQTEHEAAHWIKDKEHKTAEWWNGTEDQASSWLNKEEHASAQFWNKTEHEASGWVGDEEQRVGVWWNTTEQGAAAWFHHVDNLIEHTVQHTAESWNRTDHEIEDWWYNVTHRQKNLAQFVIYLNTTDAYRMLVHGGIGFINFAHDYFLIQQGFDAQINQAYCAVATSAAILNSLRGDIEIPVDPIYDPYPYATQADMFNHCTNSRVIRRNSSFDGIFAAPGGLSMLQTKALLECHLDTEEWNITVHHLDPDVISIEAFRQDLQNALANPKARVMINFDRKGVGQVGGGHFSPLGAFSPDMDAFLVMDVAKYKYPNAWISTSLLYKSLQTVDACGNWRFPHAQDKVPSEYLNAKTEFDYMGATVILGCESTRRGYITIEKIL